MTANKTWVYTYDRRGNILSRKTYAYTTGTLGTVQDTDTYEYFGQSSTYAWGDVLLRYDGIDYNVYDAIGNPTRYLNVNSSGDIYSFTWTNGRQLASGTKGETTFAYTYNADGLRTKKVVNGVTTEYYWAGSQLAMMVVTQVSGTKSTMRFYYDAEGRPICLTYGGSTYFYVTNLQGDVVGLANEYGTPITYEYDAWGRPISSSAISSWDEQVMNLNPLRYRGYIYDNETGFYYLQSRYYDPVVGRFINADILVSTGQGFTGFNMFAYCNNNPVMFSDPSGELSEIALALILSGVSGALSGGIAGGIGYFFEGKEFSWKGFGASVLGGAVSGAISGPVTTYMILNGRTNPVAHFFVGFGSSIVGSIIENCITGEWDIAGLLWEALWSGAGSVVGIITTAPGAGAAIGKEMAKILKKPVGKIIGLSVQKIGQDVVKESISGFTQWYAESGVEYFIKNLINSIFGEEEEEPT